MAKVTEWWCHKCHKNSEDGEWYRECDDCYSHHKVNCGLCRYCCRKEGCKLCKINKKESKAYEKN